MASSDSEEYDNNDDANRIVRNPADEQPDQQLADALRISREEYESYGAANPNTELEQIAEAKRLSLQSEIEDDDEDERRFQDALEASRRDMSEKIEKDTAADYELAAALQQSQVEYESLASAMAASAATGSGHMSANALEREKMRAARLRALGCR